MAGIDNLKEQQEKMKNGLAAEIGAKGGVAKKGSVHINTIVQELMLDPDFDAYVRDPKEGWKKLEGIPAKAIVKAQMLKALEGDTKAYDSLVKSGWAVKSEVDVTSNGETVSQPVDTDMLTQFMMTVKNNTKQ